MYRGRQTPSPSDNFAEGRLQTPLQPLTKRKGAPNSLMILENVKQFSLSAGALP